MKLASVLTVIAALTGCHSSSTEPPGKSCIAAPAIVHSLDRTDMVFIPGGSTVIGSDRFYAEESPKRRVDVASFWIDRHEVTNAEFAAFVKATGYRTVAERYGVDGSRAGGAVFREPLSVDNLSDITQWWKFDTSAHWRYPHGSSGSAADPAKPVVQITRDDALAFAQWRGRDLPTEEEWERAARGGVADADYSWADQKTAVADKANHWQGVFPLRDSGKDGYKGVAPVGCYPPNGYGIFDMAGNVWELTRSPWPVGTGAPAGAVVIKGGSWLCADNFCLRYRPAARQYGDPSIGSDHIGFRTVWRED
jgi:formylglycine-generating enzyme